MLNSSLEIDVAGWVESVKNDPVAYRNRQVTEIILNTIASVLNNQLYLKGGLLMGLAYNSPRYTVDIDFTARLAVSDDVENRIRDLLDSAFPKVTAALGYTDLVVKTNSITRQSQRTNFETARFPALLLKVGYATRGSNQEQRLLKGRAVDVIRIDISFNEPTGTPQVLYLTGGKALYAYSLSELIAEKYRAMLQQVLRKHQRSRHQDVYDLHLLIENEEIDEDCRAQILRVFLEKSRSRDIEPTRDHLDNPEIKDRSGISWDSLELEIDEVPDFETCYERVRDFYRNLPWEA